MIEDIEVPFYLIFVTAYIESIHTYKKFHDIIPQMNDVKCMKGIFRFPHFSKNTLTLTSYTCWK